MAAVCAGAPVLADVYRRLLRLNGRRYQGNPVGDFTEAGHERNAAPLASARSIQHPAEPAAGAERCRVQRGGVSFCVFCLLTDHLFGRNAERYGHLNRHHGRADPSRQYRSGVRPDRQRGRLFILSAVGQDIFLIFDAGRAFGTVHDRHSVHSGILAPVTERTLLRGAA